MPDPRNLVHEISSSTGTGNFTLVAENGKQPFKTFGTGPTPDVFDYFISNRDGPEWEVGTGHMSNDTTLVRDTIVQNSAGDTNPVNFPSGTKDVTNDVTAANIATADSAQTFAQEDASNSSVTNLLDLVHETSGVPANGIGTSLSLSAETSAGNVETGVIFAAEAVDVTAASEDFDLVISTMEGGDAASERLRFSTAGLLPTLKIAGILGGGGGVELAENLGNGTNTVTIRAAPNIGTTHEYRLPEALGTAGQFLSLSDGAGTMVWASGGTGDMATAVYDPAGVSEQLVGLTAIQTLSAKTLVGPRIQDAGTDHDYIVVPSDLAADRNVTLPLLVAPDTFVFEAHVQQLSNKDLKGCTTTGDFDITEEFRISGDIDGGTITTNTHNWNPAGLATASVIRVQSSADTNLITGIQGGADGRILIIRNIGSLNNVSFANENTNSTAANRFRLDEATTHIHPNASAVFKYDSTWSRWSMVCNSSTEPQSFVVAASDEGSDLATGTAKVTWRMPYAFSLTEILGSLTAAGTTGSMIVDVNRNGTTIMTTNKLQFLSGAETDDGNATLTTTELDKEDEMTIDIDSLHTTPAKGLKVMLVGYVR